MWVLTDLSVHENDKKESILQYFFKGKIIQRYKNIQWDKLHSILLDFAFKHFNNAN